jgi:hypothetical protein
VFVRVAVDATVLVGVLLGTAVKALVDVRVGVGEPSTTVFVGVAVNAGSVGVSLGSGVKVAIGAASKASTCGV